MRTERLTLAILTWIGQTYNRRRRQRRLGELTSIEYETPRLPAVLTPVNVVTHQT